jgi:hypothetical protein
MTVTEETFGDDDIEEVGRLAYGAVLRRLRDDEITPVGITALSKFAAWFREEAEERKRREEANRPNVAANVAEGDDFLEDLRRMYDEGRITRARLAETLPSYVALCEEHLAIAKAFAEEMSVVVPA